MLIILVIVLSSCSQKKESELNLVSKGLDVTVAPVQDGRTAGMITVTINSIPSDADRVIVMLRPENEETGDPLTNPNILLESIALPLSGQEVLLDTTTLANGPYTIVVTATCEEAPQDSPWIAVVQNPLIVEN